MYFRVGRIPTIRNALVKYGLYANKIDNQRHSLDLLTKSVYLRDWPEKWEKGWAVTKALVLQIKQAAEKRDAAFLLFSAKRELQIADDKFRTFIKQYPQLKFEQNHLNKRLEEFSRKNGVFHLSVLPAMRALREQGIAAHFSCDGHCTKEAHRKAGEILSRFIQETGFSSKIIPAEMGNVKKKT